MTRCRMAKPLPAATVSVPNAPPSDVLASDVLALGTPASGAPGSGLPGLGVLAWSLLLAGLGASTPALGAPGQAFQVRHPTYACANPRVMLALSGDAGPLHPEGWADLERAYGRCTVLTPSTQLELVARQGRLLLLRRLPRHGRELLLFVPSDEVRQVRLPAAPTTVPAVPGQTAAPPIAPSQPAPPLVAPPAVTQAAPEAASPSNGAAPTQAVPPEAQGSLPPAAVQKQPQAAAPSDAPARTGAPPVSTPPVSTPLVPTPPAPATPVPATPVPTPPPAAPAQPSWMPREAPPATEPNDPNRPRRRRLE